MNILHHLHHFAQHTASGPIFLAAGCFDGLHRGHQAVLQVAKKNAKDAGGEAWVLTFDPHPARIINPEHAPPLIFSPRQQLRHLQEEGMNGCILQPFTKEFMQQEPLEFFQMLLNCIPDLAGISVGEDWSFGRKRAGTPELMQKLCSENNLFFSALPAVCQAGERISSTQIREAIRLGHLDSIQAMLGRPLSTDGKVVQGEKIGRKLGYPTANIDPENELLPPRGIYAARLQVGDHIYPAAAYIGHRETILQNKPQVLEVHLIDEQDIDLYGKQVEVSYLSYIRDDRVFDSAEQLKTQIEQDIQLIRQQL